ncbi:MAG: UDP-N-acetylmuramoyl-L-alanyl-D-glutamate--2,6-diaminopimelate ligase [Candidatus Blackburnbacteria bacterium]|nr:UDP-N-acetylmuramoyl-L-alanyl-D-glutamate--2,6-diaminopimelate ligase [Candidatus Blackburnbacteria bacterium]
MENITTSVIARYKNAKHFLRSFWEVLKNGYPARKLTVIGVTGTDGKTTTSHLIYEILKEAGYKAGLVSTVGAWVGEEYRNTGFHITTPNAKMLQPFLKRLVEDGVTHLVLETTSHALDQHRVLGCNFKIGVLTNVTHEHLDYHKTIERYQKAKAKLFKGVKVAVLNNDDGAFDYFKGVTNPRAKIMSYSLQGQASLRARNAKAEGGITRFSVLERDKTHSLTTTLSGEYNISNILGAVGVARAMKVRWAEIKLAISGFEGVSGRMEVIADKPFKLIVDFAHTPNALESLLSSLARPGLVSLGRLGRLIVVFGCAGERDIAKRPMMGEISTRLADISIFTAEDPRSEDVNTIIGQIAKGARAAGAVETESRRAKLFHLPGGINRFIREPDRRQAIRLAVKLAKPHDIVVICGKGHEKSMAYGKIEKPWSDQKEAREALNARKLN